MKKLIMILSAFMLTVSTVSTVIACDKTNGKKYVHKNQNPENLTAQQRADQAAEELEELSNPTFSISINKKTKDDVSTHIEKAAEVEEILTKYETNIEGKLTLKLLNGSDLKVSDIEDGLVLKVSGKLKVDSVKAYFKIPKVTIKMNASSDKQKAEQAAKKLSLLPHITLLINGNEKNMDQVIENIENIAEIKDVVSKYKAKIVKNSLKFKNLYDNVFKVSGTLEVGIESADFEIQKVILTTEYEDAMHKYEANVVADLLSKLTAQNIKFKASELTGNKVDDLNQKLHEDDRIKAIIKNSSIKVKGDKFTFKVGSADANKNNLMDKTDVTVSGNIEVNGQISDSEFKFIVKLEDKTDKEIANEAVEELSKLKDIIYNKYEIKETDKLNITLAENPVIKNIINGDNVKLKDEKFTLKNGKNILNDSEFATKSDLVVTVSGKIEVNEAISDNEFYFNIKLEPGDPNDPEFVNARAIASKIVDKFSKLTAQNITFTESYFETLTGVMSLNDKIYELYIKESITIDIIIQRLKYDFKVNGVNNSFKAGSVVTFSCDFKVKTEALMDYKSANKISFNFKLVP